MDIHTLWITLGCLGLLLAGFVWVLVDSLLYQRRRRRELKRMDYLVQVWERSRTKQRLAIAPPGSGPSSRPDR